MATRGRPKINIDKSNFEGLCGLQCTLTDIADFFRCSEDTIQNWCKATYNENFSVVYKRYSVAGRISLRRSQFALAKKNATMAIWLGKQMLGQKDVQTVDNNVTFNNPYQNISTEDLIKLARSDGND